MPNDMEPIVGNWYCHRSKGQLFQVIEVDLRDRLVEIQRFDGDLEEFDLEDWAALDLDAAAPPEDWTGPIDELDPDDLSYSECAMDKRDWRGGTGEYPSGRESWEPDDSEAELDDGDDELAM
jgi:hypothetical protein